jgi:hypothetical protein
MINKKTILIVGLAVVAIGVSVFLNARRAHIDNQDIVDPVYTTALDMTYITTPDAVWPPAVVRAEKAFECVSGGNEVLENGKTVMKELLGEEYCVTTASEGAAGSVYTTYTYKTAIEKDVTASTEFTLRFVQCDNYDDPQKTDCKKEQLEFNPDNLAYAIIQDSLTKIVNEDLHCYAYHQEATPTAPYAVDEYVSITINGNEISGTKKGTQNGPDMTNGYEGTLTGSKEQDVMTLLFAYTIEGSQNTEKEIYQFVKTGIEKWRYPLIEEGGILVPDTTKYYKTLSYKTIDCATIE